MMRSARSSTAKVLYAFSSTIGGGVGMVRLSLASKKHASRYHILPEPAHMIMAQACLGILIRLDDQVDVNEESINTFPFARYAADHIGDHVELGGRASTHTG